MLVETARAQLPSQAQFNLVRIEAAKAEVAFLNYPELGTSPFPPLVESWRVHTPSNLVTQRKYSGSSNPPILHRTELLLPDAHPARSAFALLTQSCEAIGLFDNPAIIGFQRNWQALIREKGFALNGAELVPIANSTGEDEINSEPLDGTVIQRHRTALSRSSISAPVQCLLRDALLTQESSFFDYGCGKGDDVAALAANGYQCAGWDPHFRPHVERTSASVVNLGFVINVIEDYEERVAALESAYALTKGVLAVSAMLASSGIEKFATYGDGVITSRATFQKYYSQGELQAFIESVLGEDAYSAAPGIFYVFKDRELEQRYLLRKAGGASSYSRAPRVGLRVVKRRAERRPARVSRDQSPEALELLVRLWKECLARGRRPDPDEIPIAADLRLLFGSFNKALRKCLETYDPSALECATRQRRADILVMLALRMFERRRKFSSLDFVLGKDVRAFFGSMRDAEANARELLFSIQDQKALLDSARIAATAGYGYMDAEHALHIHTSLLPRLPAVLRVFVGCASAMAGDLATYDLAKIHIGSGKVTLLQYDDFVDRPIPGLVKRVKVRLRDQQIDVFDYVDRFEPTLLFHKSQYINEDFPRYAEQVAFEEALSQAALMDSSSHGPTISVFDEQLRKARYRISEFRLLRSVDIPSLDEKCGSHLTYRDLVECGETWTRERPNNEPKSPDTFNALCDLARVVLDPVIEYYGSIKLTYGFASHALTRRIGARIAPRLDQHASCEVSQRGRPICGRMGAAVDFLVEYEDMREVASWIAANCAFDRLYFYGSDRPIHVSVGPQNSRQVFELLRTDSGRVPRKMAL